MTPDCINTNIRENKAFIPSFQERKRPVGLTFVILTLVVLSFCLNLVPEADAQDYKKTDILADGSFHRFDVTNLTDNSKHLQVNVVISDGKRCDVYIMNHDEYEYYRDGRDFDTYKSKENQNSIDFSWAQYQANKTFYLVIDNKDNAHANDAEPNGDLTYALEYKVEKEDEPEFAGWGILFAAGCVIIGILVILVVIVKLGVRLVRGPKQQFGSMKTDGQPSIKLPHDHGYQRAPDQLEVDGRLSASAGVGDCSGAKARCPQCGFKVQMDWKVCPKCTSELKLGPPDCPQCGETVEPDWKVCPRCTTSLR